MLFILGFIVVIGRAYEGVHVLLFFILDQFGFTGLTIVYCIALVRYPVLCRALRHLVFVNGCFYYLFNFGWHWISFTFLRNLSFIY